MISTTQLATSLQYNATYHMDDRSWFVTDRWQKALPRRSKEKNNALDYHSHPACVVAARRGRHLHCRLVDSSSLDPCCHQHYLQPDVWQESGLTLSPGPGTSTANFPGPNR